MILYGWKAHHELCFHCKLCSRCMWRYADFNFPQTLWKVLIHVLWPQKRREQNIGEAKSCRILPFTLVQYDFHVLSVFTRSANCQVPFFYHYSNSNPWNPYDVFIPRLALEPSIDPTQKNVISHIMIFFSNVIKLFINASTS